MSTLIKDKGKLFIISLILTLFLSSIFLPLNAKAQTSQEVERLVDEGIMYERQNRLDEAIEIYRRVLELDPENILVKVRLAKVLSWKNNFEEALSILNSVLQQVPEQSEALFRKAQILSWQKNYSESIEAYKKYLQIKKDDADALMGIARVYFWSGRYEDAINYFNRAVQAGANEVEARLELGKVYLAMNNTTLAKEQFIKVIELDPDNKDAKRFLKGIPALITFELIPVAFSWDIYPDSSLGITASSSLTYHHKQVWNISLLYEDTATGGFHDQTFTLTNVFMGIHNLYMLGSFFYTPEPDFSPETGGEVGATLSIQGGFGAGVYISADLYREAPAGVIQNDTLFAIKPEIVKYFGDLNFILIRYNHYLYTSGYSTSTLNLSMNMEYYEKNILYAGFTYGGDVETRNKERRIFEIALGISCNVTENLELFFYYSLIETQYGKTNQIKFNPLIKW